MSNHGLQACDDGYAKPTESVGPNQSRWMNRWLPTSSNSTQVQNQLSRHDVNRGKIPDLEQGDRVSRNAESSNHKRLDMNAAPCDFSEYRNSWRCQREDIVVASSVPQSTKAVEVVTESKRVEITYETLITNSRNIRTSRLELQPISAFTLSEKMESILAQKRLAVSTQHESNIQSDNISKHGTNKGPGNPHLFFNALRSAPLEAAFPLKEYPFQPESNVQYQSQLPKPYISLNKDKMHNGKSGNRMNSFTSARRLPTQSSSVQLRRLQELNNGCHSSSEGLQSDELRLFRSKGAFEAVSRGPGFSQTNNHLPIRSVSKGNQLSRASSVSSKFKGSAPLQFTLLPGFDCHEERSEKLHPLENPRNSEGKKDKGNSFQVSKNESSTGTGSMDINVCQTWNSLPSITSSPSDKDSLGKNPSGSQATRKRNIELPDINQEPPPAVDAAAETENMDLSTSRTESLDMDHLLRIDPSNRWVKRLKLSSSDDNATCSKPDKNFSEVRKMEVDKISKPAVVDETKKRWGINLSHPWIRRWCHNQAGQKMDSAAPLVCELESSKMALDEDGSKQFPSIGAMALMGKAMNGLQACKFQNKGSFVTWNTERSS